MANIFGLITLMLLKLLMTFARDIYVRPEGSDVEGCGTVKNACYSMRFAIKSSSPNSIIFVEGPRAFELKSGPIGITHNLTMRPHISNSITLEHCKNNSGIFRIFNDAQNQPVSVTLNRFYFRNCSSSTLIYLEDAILIITNSTFEESGVLVRHQQVPSNNCSKITVIITNSKFIMNYLEQPLREAFSLYGCDFTTVTVTNSEFCSSPISIKAFIQDISFTNVNFKSQSSIAHLFHSQLSHQSNLISFNNCSFTSKAKFGIIPILILFKSAYSTHQSIIHFVNANFSLGSKLSGAALHISPIIANKDIANLKVNLRSCQFCGCSSEGNGGAIHIRSIKMLIISQCSFTNNSAASGGALSLHSVESVQITNSVFLWNSARFANTFASQGGAIYALSSGLSVTHSSFINNAAHFEGDSIYAFLSTYISLDNSLLKSCHDVNSSPGDAIIVLKSCAEECSNINISNVDISIEPSSQAMGISLISAEGRIKMRNVATTCPSTYELRWSSVDPEVTSLYDHRIVGYWCQPTNNPRLIPLY